MLENTTYALSKFVAILHCL